MLPASSRWRDGAGHDVAHRRCRQAGTSEYDAVELAKLPSTLSNRSGGRQQHGARHGATHRRCRQAGAAEADDMEYATTPPTVDVVKPESRKTTTWRTPRRRPPSMSSSRNRGRRRHGARHDAAHRRRRQAGAVEDDDMEHTTTLPIVEVVKPEPRKTMTWSTPRRRPPSMSSSWRQEGRQSTRHHTSGFYSITPIAKPNSANSCTCLLFVVGGSSRWSS